MHLSVAWVSQECVPAVSDSVCVPAMTDSVCVFQQEWQQKEQKLRLEMEALQKEVLHLQEENQELLGRLQSSLSKEGELCRRHNFNTNHTYTHNASKPYISVSTAASHNVSETSCLRITKTSGEGESLVECRWQTGDQTKPNCLLHKHNMSLWRSGNMFKLLSV